MLINFVCWTPELSNWIIFKCPIATSFGSECKLLVHSSELYLKVLNLAVRRHRLFAVTHCGCIIACCQETGVTRTLLLNDPPSEKSGGYYRSMLLLLDRFPLYFTFENVQSRNYFFYENRKELIIFYEFVIVLFFLQSGFVTQRVSYKETYNNRYYKNIHCVLTNMRSIAKQLFCTCPWFWLTLKFLFNFQSEQ